MGKKIKVLLAKLGLDVHNRGIITVAKKLRNAGMEVVYLGNALPDEIIRSAIQEDVDMVGISSLSGAHLSLGSLLIREAEKENFKDNIVYVIGGVFPPADAQKLREIGFDGIFTPGATGDDIVSSIQRMVAEKQETNTSLPIDP
ncbi:MAG: cobalamin B12-binding domain-containing protein [Deltaproteobacteria bacterium]|nr:cobalamin B12-binding domain-containing protein [Deltaproteobacteria bacterium]